MKKFLLIAAALVTLTVPAFAQDATKPGYTDDLTVEQALNVALGLGQLTSYDTTDKDGKPAKVYFKFDPDIRILIAVNIDVGRAVQSRFQVEQNQIVMRLSEGAGKVPEDKMGAFNVEISDMMKAKARAGFYRIKTEDLCMKLTDKCKASGVDVPNQIPAPVLSLLVPIWDR